MTATVPHFLKYQFWGTRFIQRTSHTQLSLYVWRDTLRKGGEMGWRKLKMGAPHPQIQMPTSLGIRLTSMDLKDLCGGRLAPLSQWLHPTFVLL